MKQKFDSYFGQYGFYLLPLAILAVVIFLFLNNDLPLIEKLVNLRRNNLAARERLAVLSAKSDLLTGLNQRELENNYQNLSYILPDGKDAPSILRTIDTAALASGVVILSLDLAPGTLATESGKQSEIPIEVTVSGNFSQIAGFTAELVNLGRVLTVKTLDAVFEKTSANVKASYEIRAFYFSPSSIVAKVDEPLLEINSNEKETLVKALKRFLLVPQTILIPSPKTDLFK